ASALSLDMRASFTLSKRPSGGSVRVMLVARRQGSEEFANAYRAAVEIWPNGTILYGGRKLVSGQSLTIGQAATAPFAFAAGTRYSVRAQVTGSQPTVLRVKLWRAGPVGPAG